MLKCRKSHHKRCSIKNMFLKISHKFFTEHLRVTAFENKTNHNHGITSSIGIVYGSLLVSFSFEENTVSQVWLFFFLKSHSFPEMIYIFCFRQYQMKDLKQFSFKELQKYFILQKSIIAFPAGN